MIASVRGPVAHVGLDHVVVEVGGVGMLVHTTPATASGCRRGSEASLATTLVVREDSLTLYGFSAPAERDMFETAADRLGRRTAARPGDALGHGPRPARRGAVLG